MARIAPWRAVSAFLQSADHQIASVASAESARRLYARQPVKRARTSIVPERFDSLLHLWGSREYLTEREIERLMEAAKQNRSGHRDVRPVDDSLHTR
jgi:hypothetical protein